MEGKKENEKILIELNKDEATVLLEWLSSFNAKNDKSHFEDQSEQRILWDMEAVLEASISDILSPDYKNILLRARKTLRDGND